jgi:hypothetical protein
LAAAVLAIAPGTARGQEHIERARIEHRRVTQPIAREIESAASGSAAAWVAYRTPAIPSGRAWCNAPVQLEPATEVIVLARVTARRLDRLRTFAPSCTIDAGGMPLVWLDGVTPDASATWLASLVSGAAAAGERNPPLLSPALAALEATPGNAALEALLRFARIDARPDVRSRAIASLAFRAEADAAAAVRNAIDNDPDTAVKKAALGALARMPGDEGIPLLIQVARTNRNTEVRKQAMFWLGESKDPRAVSFFEEILRK